MQHSCLVPYVAASQLKATGKKKHDKPTNTSCDKEQEFVLLKDTARNKKEDILPYNYLVQR